MVALARGRPEVAIRGAQDRFCPRLRENVRARKVRRIVFSIVLSRQPSPALLFFKLIEVNTKFLFAKSISEFSCNQDPYRTSREAACRCRMIWIGIRGEDDGGACYRCRPSVARAAMVRICPLNP